MKKSQLKNLIDKMVEDSIRRVLPSVMNEVLIKTITSSINEERVVPKNIPQNIKKKIVRPARQNARTDNRSLREILNSESAGSEFYEQFNQTEQSVNVEEDNFDDFVEHENPLAQRISSLPPQLQSLAEDVEIPEENMEMWEDEGYSSQFAAVPSDLAPVRNPKNDAAKIGIDFNRMKQVSNITSKKENIEDVRSNKLFEEQRIKRMREKLESQVVGGK